LLIGVGLGGAQFVIEVDDRRDDTKFVAQFQQQTKECNGIDPAGNGNANAISCAQEFLLPKVGEYALRQ
jgi:hypothetical protein